MTDNGPLQEQIGGDHYKGMAIQPVEFCQRNHLGFIEGCIIKYVCRYARKGGEEDLRKAMHFLRMLQWLEYGAEGEEIDRRLWIYIAGPYTSDPTHNTAKARKLANKVWDAGYWPEVPHNTHEWHMYSPKPYEKWIAYGMANLRRCHAMLWDRKAIPGPSPGAAREEQLAKRLGIPVFYSFEELLEGLPCRSQPAIEEAEG